MIWLLAALLAVGLATWLLSDRSGTQKRFRWTPIYEERSAQPYGTQVLFRLLKIQFSDHNVVKITEDLDKMLPLDEDEVASYFFIGEKPYFDSASTAHLLAFVASGHTAFLCSEGIPFDLMFYLYDEECPEAPWAGYQRVAADTVVLSLKGNDRATADVFFVNRNRPAPFSWASIPNEHFCPSMPQRPLGWANDSHIIFACFPYGKGFFFFHTIPLAFTNYHLLRPEMQRYAEALLAYLPEGDIYWDVKYRDPEVVQQARNAGWRPASEHPLKYILQQPSLAWAWYLLLALAILYVIFRAKRRQAIVPVWPRKENNTFEYVNMLAQMHFQQQNYGYLCDQMMKTFLRQVRERFRLDLPFEALATAPVPSAFVAKLSELSNVPEGDIRVIFTNYTATAIYEATPAAADALSSSIRAFWNKAYEKGTKVR